ncbi:MAG TPA: hypothetical protein VE981_23120 [Planctomycetota bacterium]|nr:hypothetical protein [Planctomycetota bacterium]
MTEEEKPPPPGLLPKLLGCTGGLVIPFRTFIKRGNVPELAVGVIVGASSGRSSDRSSPTSSRPRSAFFSPASTSAR